MSKNELAPETPKHYACRLVMERLVAAGAWWIEITMREDAADRVFVLSVLAIKDGLGMFWGADPENLKRIEAAGFVILSKRTEKIKEYDFSRDAYYDKLTGRMLIEVRYA